MAAIKKIQLSPVRVVPDALVVWYEAGPEVEIVMDLKNLTFASNSIEELYAFHVLDHMFDADVRKAIANWATIVAPKGKLFVVVDDFEFLSRSLVGGDIGINDFNKEFSHPTQFTRDNLVEYLKEPGVFNADMSIWYADVPDKFRKREHELVVSCEKI